MSVEQERLRPLFSFYLFFEEENKTDSGDSRTFMQMRRSIRTRAPTPLVWAREREGKSEVKTYTRVGATLLSPGLHLAILLRILGRK